MAHLLFVLALLIATQAGAVLAMDEGFAEELLLRPLPDGKLLAHFHFTSELPPVAAYGTHHRMFPKAIFQLVRKFHIREMEMSFTQGRWDYIRWGAADPIVQAAAKPAGVELMASFDVPEEEVDYVWSNLTHALSGLFCSSITFLESPSYIDPWFAFRPGGNWNITGEHHQIIVNQRTSTATGVRYGALPREAVCTENLTPWLKLLPCRDKAGLSELLDRSTIYSGFYHSLQLAIKSGDFGGSSLDGTTLEQSLTVVLRDGTREGTRWSVPSIFRKTMRRCPLAKTSKVYLDLDQEGLVKQEAKKEEGIVKQDTELGSPSGFAGEWLIDNEALISPSPHKIASDASKGGGVLLEYEVPERTGAPLELTFAKKKTVPSRRGEFYVTRFLTGSGNARGSVAILFHRYSQAAAEESWVMLLQMIPWYVRLYGHTLQVSADGHRLEVPKAVRLLRFTPGEDRKSPTAMEMILCLPPNTQTAAITMEYDKGFLHIAEHPPDANRGFDLPAAIVSFPTRSVRRWYSAGWQPSPLQRLLQKDYRLALYTEVLLMPLATPDFSMPYNVIVFTCTVLALYFGSLLKALRRRIGEEERAREASKTQQTRRTWLSDRRRNFKAAGLVAVIAVAAAHYLTQ